MPRLPTVVALVTLCGCGAYQASQTAAPYGGVPFTVALPHEAWTSGVLPIRAGDLAATPLLRSRGRDALARVSLHLYNEPAEIDRLAEELERLGA
jgi:selenocysteine lyase/cysteine desulfurase